MDNVKLIGCGAGRLLVLRFWTMWGLCMHEVAVKLSMRKHWA
jgi:hypothetical protein